MSYDHGTTGMIYWYEGRKFVFYCRGHGPKRCRTKKQAEQFAAQHRDCYDPATHQFSLSVLRGLWGQRRGIFLSPQVYCRNRSKIAK